MFDHLREQMAGVEGALDEIEPLALVGPQPAACIELIQRHERTCAAMRLALTARASAQHPWENEGFRTFEDWLAAATGTSQGQAKRRAKAAKNLTEQDDVAEALANGDISEDQADVVSDAAAKNPGDRKELLNTAKNKHKTHKDLQDQAAKSKAAGEDDRSRSERLRKGRNAHWGPDRDGFFGLGAQQHPEIGAELKAVLDGEVDRILKENRRRGVRSTFAQVRADALASLLLGLDVANRSDHTGVPQPTDSGQETDGPADAPSTDRVGRPDPRSSHPGRTVIRKEIVLVVDLDALRRGCVAPGETCHIAGVGQVPVEVARRWVDDAFVKAVVKDGGDIKAVAHYGRHLPARIRTALGLNPCCSVPGCNNPRIEIDHKQARADHGLTSLDNLRPLCVHHHRLRTHEGYELHGPPGRHTWHHPDGRILSADDLERATTETARAP